MVVAITLLPQAHVKQVCKPGTPDCCAYLASRMLPDFFCAKGDPDILKAVEARLAEGTLEAKGDNCSGPPDYQVEGGNRV